MRVAGKKRRSIDEGWFTGVYEHDGAFYAAEHYTGSIRVYEKTGGWKECRCIDLGCGSQNITISIHDNMIYACLLSDTKLMAYSLSGEQKRSWGNAGIGKAGELDVPYLCMTDAGGAALIADSDNNRLQALGANRQWSIVSLQPPVMEPMSALFHCGRLFVTSFKDKRLYVYDPK